MTFPVHTQKSLDRLTWNEIQKLHTSLGLKATSTTRTRRDYQRRIVEAQPQPVAADSVPATFTCAVCPFARHIDGDRYCCQVSQTASDVKRGHWEATISCFEALAAAEAEKVTAETEAPIAPADTSKAPAPPVPVTAGPDDEPPNRGDSGRGRVILSAPTVPVTIAVIPHAKAAEENLVSSMVKESPEDKEFCDLLYLVEQQKNAQLAIEKTIIGSEDEAIAYAHLEKINQDIEYYGKPRPVAQPSPIVVQLETQMTELKRDTMSLFKITAFDPAILPTDTDEPEPSVESVKPEGTIHWEIPQLRGTIVGKKGATRRFWVQNDDIHIALSPDFTAKESKHPNIRHQQIRVAIESGKQFNPMVFKLSPSFEQTEDYNGIGRILQSSDGRWWAWAKGGVTGHPFLSKELAFNYLEACNFTSKRLATVK